MDIGTAPDSLPNCIYWFFFIGSSEKNREMFYYYYHCLYLMATETKTWKHYVICQRKNIRQGLETCMVGPARQPLI